MKILIVEDESELLTSIQQFLSEKGYTCEVADHFQLAFEKISLYDYDVMVLDIMLPDGNGLELLKNLKEINPATGVLIISAKDALDDKIKGLEWGADDYLTKPFHLPELHARVNAIFRRRQLNGNQHICFNEIEIDPEGLQVWVNGKQIALTRKEFDLLLYLVVNKNRVLTKEAIALHLWGDYIETADNFDFLYSHIKNLRKKNRPWVRKGLPAIGLWAGV